MSNLRYVIRNGEKVLQQVVYCYKHKDNGWQTKSKIPIAGYIPTHEEWKDIPTVKEEDNE